MLVPRYSYHFHNSFLKTSAFVLLAPFLLCVCAPELWVSVLPSSSRGGDSLQRLSLLCCAVSSLSLSAGFFSSACKHAQVSLILKVNSVTSINNQPPLSSHSSRSLFSATHLERVVSASASVLFCFPIHRGLILL